MAKRVRPDISSFFIQSRKSKSEVVCPVCGTFFAPDKIAVHASTCGLPGDPASTLKTLPVSSSSTAQRKVPGNNAFSALMGAAAKEAKQRSLSSATFHLELDSASGRLTTSFLFDAERKGTGSTPNDCAWSDVVQLRKFCSTLVACGDGEGEGGGEGEGEGERSSLSLTLTTNIPSYSSSSGFSFSQGTGTGEGDKEQPQGQGQGQGQGGLHVSVKKSMIQKAIRRRLGGSALRLCVDMLQGSLADCLRRLPIIIMEDASLHPSLPQLCWLMMATSKRYAPPPPLLAHVVQVCVEVAASSCRDRETAPAAGRRPVALSSLPSGPRRTLVAALLMRAAYGGMEGDVSMLESYAHRWAERFFLSGPHPTTTTQPPALLSSTFPAAFPAPTFLQDVASTTWGQACLSAFAPAASASACDSVSDNGFPPDEVRMLLAEALGTELCSVVQNGPGKFSSSMALLSLPLRGCDLVTYGIDAHCDFGLVPLLLQRCGEAVARHHLGTTNQISAKEEEKTALVTKEIKSAIWLHRSSCNMRTLWLNGATSSDELAQVDAAVAVLQHSAAADKKALAATWRCIAKELNTYCNMRVSEYAKKL